MWIASKGLKSESFWGIQLLDDGRLSFSATWRDNLTRQGQWESTQRVMPNQWTHIAVSYERYSPGEQLFFFLNTLMK